MPKQLSIFGMGTVVIDHVVTLPEFPAADTKSPITSSWRQIGGPVPVALSVANHYGAKVSFCGRWGNDATGEEVQQGLADRGIHLSASQSHDDWATGFAQIWVDAKSGSRTIAYSRGDFPPPTSDDLANCPALQNCQLLHLDGTFPNAALAAATAVNGRGGQVILDAGSKKPGMEALLPVVDVLIASDEFCRRWFGSTDVALADLRNLGPRIAIRTLGERGVVFDAGEGAVALPAKKIEPVDTNGAGDIFSGALLFGLSSEWTLKRSISFANAAAGFACCHRGNSTWMPL